GLALATLNSDKINRLDKELKKLDKKVDSQGKRIDSIARFLSNDGPDSDGDGVPDVRDKDPHTPPNTPVDFWGKPLNINEYNHASNKTNNSFGNFDDTPAVYFDFDRIDLGNGALETISKIASRMKADPSLYVEARGYCDYLGKNPYNESLSKKRAERVKTELVKIWKIPADHIIANGKGKIIEPRIRYRPNRRCDFFFDKQ
ncbi:MAG TPA: OmpA family protein, partial [Paludibacter sp.]|nr:OmpA family protein [Paludibacter sp.]